MSTREPRRERKVVTALFCDLVGFTSQAESLDPEDAEAILRPYHACVRAELERHGGTVEKFARAREIKDNQVLLPTPIASAMVSAVAERELEARARADEAIRIARHNVLGVGTLGQGHPLRRQARSTARDSRDPRVRND